MTQPARGYQPYQPMAPMMGAPTPPKRSRGGLTTLLAGVLALVVAGLAVGGSFGSITDYRNSYEIDEDPSVYATSTTWWGFLDAGSSSPIEEETILTGLTLVLAGTLLLLGAVFAFVAARTRTSGPVAGGRSLISAGVGVLAGVTLLQLLAVLKQMETYNEQELDAGESLEFTAGLGLWLPLAGVVLGIVAVVLAHVGQRPAAARVEPNTPRMGFPAPYGYRPQAPERVTEVHISDEDAAADTQVVSGATVSGADVSEQLTSPSGGSGAASAPQGGAPAAGGSAAGGSAAGASAAGASAAGASAAGGSAAGGSAVATDPAPADPAAPVTPPAPTTPPAAPATPASPAAAPQAESPAPQAEPATPQAEPTPAAAPQAESATPQAEPTPAAAPQAEPAAPQAEPASAAAPQAESATVQAESTPAAAPQADATPAEPAAPAKPEAEKPEGDEPAKPTPLSELPAAPPAPELSSPDDKTK